MGTLELLSLHMRGVKISIAYTTAKVKITR